jgi:hypothetical protein
VSPLLNAFEAGAGVDSPCPMVDAFRVEMAQEPGAVKLLGALAGVCDRTEDPNAVRGALNELSWSLLDASLSAAPGRALARAAAMAQRHRESLGADHRRVLEAIMDHASPDAGLTTARPLWRRAEPDRPAAVWGANPLVCG